MKEESMYIDYMKQAFASKRDEIALSMIQSLVTSRQFSINEYKDMIEYAFILTDEYIKTINNKSL